MFKDVTIGRNRRDVEAILNILPINNVIPISRNNNHAFKLPVTSDRRLMGIDLIALIHRNLFRVAKGKIFAHYLGHFLSRGWFPFGVIVFKHGSST